MVSMNKALESSPRGPDLTLFVRDVRDRQGRRRPVTVRSWSTIKDVKDAIQKIINVPSSMQRLFYGPLLTSGGELPNHRTLQDAGIYRSGETILLDIKIGEGSSSSFSGSMSSLRSPSASHDVCISTSMLDSTPKSLSQLVQQARRGMALGLKPEFVLDGSGGTYFLHDARKAKIAVFKPADEEPYAENNPRGYIRQAGDPVVLREGVVPGEACIREVAAYLLDHGGFSGVPMTTLVEANHPTFNTNGARLKVAEGGAAVGNHSIGNHTVSSHSPGSARKPGSFQEFVRSDCTMDDMSPSKISVDEVHKIAILDIRIMNADRNAANLLCRRKRDNSFELIPIDHGFCLRSVCDVSWMDWCWLDWAQLKRPLSERSKKYILDLDIEADAHMLRERLNICQEAVDYFRASSRLLQAGVKAGLSLYEIAVMCCRDDNLGEVPSKLEVLTSMASELASSAVENGRWSHAAASRALAEQLAPNGGSLLHSDRSNALRMRKSASTAYFASFFDETETLDQPVQLNEVPGMASSVSDSSSDVDEMAVDCEEDCEEWAAALIADVSLDKSMSIFQSKARSASVESESGSDTEFSSSPKGFWHVPPCTSPSIASDDESIQWSPHIAPKKMTDAPFLPLDIGPRVTFAEQLVDVKPYKGLRLPMVSFADFSAVDLRLPASMPDLDKDDTLESSHGTSFLSSSLERQEGGGLGRSRSYTALSSIPSEESRISSTGKKPLPLRTHDFDQLRDYFLKFVDLVIVRETTAASQQVAV